MALRRFGCGSEHVWGGEQVREGRSWRSQRGSRTLSGPTPGRERPLGGIGRSARLRGRLGVKTASDENEQGPIRIDTRYEFGQPGNRRKNLAFVVTRCARYGSRRGVWQQSCP